jgi:hypothetical protein
MISEPKPSLSFHQIDDDLDTPGFFVEAHGDRYSGVTEIWLFRGHINEFVDALDQLDSSLKGEARLRAGWVDQGEEPSDAAADLVLVIRPWGAAGQLEVDVTMRASATVGGRNSVRVWFVIPEPNALTRFRKALRSLAGGGAAAPAILTAAIPDADI